MNLKSTILRRKEGILCSGFTLVEMLTTIAIIATLATLLMAAVSGAKRKSRQAVCLSNLRQYSLALNMYLDDERRRPNEITTIVESGYLPNAKVLLCPEDHWSGWGNQVNSVFGAGYVNEVAQSGLSFSFLHPLNWQDWAWNAILRRPSNGAIGVCQLHGIGRPDENSPSFLDFQGLTLRAHVDGAVTKGMTYWDSAYGDTDGRWGDSGAIPANPEEPETPGSDGLSSPGMNAENYPWPLFMDQVDQIPVALNP